MGRSHVINVDLADVWSDPERTKLLRTLAWGDQVSVVGQTESYIEVEFKRFQETPDGSILPSVELGYIVPRKSSGVGAADVVIPKRHNQVLKISFVDVQQGDGAVIESPDGKVVLVDGGDNQLFARYLAGRFQGTTAEKPQPIECMLVTHGDADHFVGLPEILRSESHPEVRKRLFIQPKRVFHNGLVKRPGTREGKRVPDRELLGPTRKHNGELYIVGLEEDLLSVDDDEMNRPFRAWKDTLATYNDRARLECRRLALGDDEAFSFLADENIQVEVLGPLVTDLDGVPALKFLGNPPKGPRIGQESLATDDLATTGLSASHTINGHSIVFRLTYGNFSYLFSGDLNDEAGRFLTREHNRGNLNLRADVFKVPHHGSADFSGAFIQAVAPVVSVVSSGDESARKEYIHPRATLIGALGRWSRVAEPLVFVTELVAFFNVEGQATLTDKRKAEERGPFFAFSRTAFGIVKTRTDGHRLLVYTDSGNIKLKEAYAFSLDGTGMPKPEDVVRV
ncbi:competence protein [Microvirga vignae]|uniref:Competence protein n=1 Tax=Microvirga vignae TaxID=1225564 RepID=A0A0H1RFF5_9HYPH|nr:MBL fold metallo-hydrolase [Microvirga vignae]KLK93804.1 competence protein [Microvirga vignae]